jgi:crossover junction endodeoxyribonuclease RuvC
MRDRRIRVIGIDPGSILCGYGIIAEDRSRNLIHISSGTIKLPKSKPLASRLKMLHEELREVLREFDPQESAIEKVFFAKNIKSVLQLGQARGVVLLSIAEADLAIHEYNPNEVKKAVVGYGKAEKSQVQQMVKTILSLNSLPSPDSADALALAICHLNTTAMGHM